MPVSAEDTQKIHSKARWGNADELGALLQQEGAALCVDATNGNRPIHIAAQNGKMVLDAGGDVNTQNNNGQTALHMSVAYDYFWTTKLLLEAGADRSLVNEDGHKAEVGIDAFFCEFVNESRNPAIGDAKIDNALAAFTDSRTEEELDIALGMATGDQDKSAWVQKFMGRKRAEPELFTAEVQAKCKEVIFSMP